MIPIVQEAAFLHHWPRPYRIEAMTVYTAAKLGYPTDRTYYRFLEPFEYLSEKWGSIVIPAGFDTDFASVPPSLRSLYDNDSPILLYPSAPHDYVFQRGVGGMRGWLPDGRRLTMEQANDLLLEAMATCGASGFARHQVGLAVGIGNWHLEREFA